MALVVSTDMSGQEMAERIAATAAHKDHKLAAYLVDGRHPVNPAQFDGIMRHLSGCQDLPRPEEDMARPTGAERYFGQREAVSPEYREALSGAREQVRKSTSFQDIPEGFYATPGAGSNEFDFWKVTIGKNGFRRVKRVIGGGSAQVPATVEIGKSQQMTALRAIIEAGIPESSDLYAAKEVRCVDCGRQLTDDDSIAARKGPICRSK